MNTLVMAVRELFGLFVDDEFLALGILAVVLLTAVLREGLAAGTLVSAAVLLGGCLGVLAATVRRTARSRRQG